MIALVKPQFEAGRDRIGGGGVVRDPAVHAAILREVSQTRWGTSDPAVPFGGVKSSGVGREHGREGLDGYLETKTVWAALS